jgi:multidrug efflux pump subunit AcrB
MLHGIFKRCIRPFFQTILLSILCSTLYASELLPIANDLNPSPYPQVKKMLDYSYLPRFYMNWATSELGA